MILSAFYSLLHLKSIGVIFIAGRMVSLLSSSISSHCCRHHRYSCSIVIIYSLFLSPRALYNDAHLYSSYDTVNCCEALFAMHISDFALFSMIYQTDRCYLWLDCCYRCFEHHTFASSNLCVYLLNVKQFIVVSTSIRNAMYQSIWCQCVVDGVLSKRACVFCLSVPHGPSKRSLVTFQADDQYTKKSWLECLESVCKNARLHVDSSSHCSF